MNKKILAIGLASVMFAGSSIAATQTQTGEMNVTGTIGDSTCSISFPSSVTMPLITSAAYNGTKQHGLITSQTTEGIVFSGCSGKSVSLQISAPNKTAASGFWVYPTLNGKEQGTIGLAVQVLTSKGSSATYSKINVADPSLTDIEVTGDSFSLPVTVGAFRMSNRAATSTGFTGQYQQAFVFTATYQ